MDLLGGAFDNQQQQPGNQDNSALNFFNGGADNGMLGAAAAQNS